MRITCTHLAVLLLSVLPVPALHAPCVAATDGVAAAEAPSPAAVASADASAKAAPTAPAAPADAPIAPEDIADRADALVRKLDAVRPGAETVQAVEKIKHGIAALDRELLPALERAKLAAATGTSLMAIQDVRREIDSASTSFPAWKKQLENEARRAGAALEEIESAVSRWSRTRTQPETIEAGDVVIARVDTSLALLAQGAEELQAWRAQILALSDRLLDRRTAIEAALARLEEATIAEGKTVVVPGEPPLWKRDLARRLSEELPRLPEQFAAFQRSTLEYLTLDARPFLLQGMLAVVLMLLFRSLPLRARSLDIPAHSARLLEHPYALAILLTLILSPMLHPTAPHRVTQLIGLVTLIPVARLLTVANDRSNAWLYAGLAALLLVDRLAIAFSELPALAVVMFFAELAMASVLMLAYRRRLLAADGSPSLVRALTFGVYVLGVAAAAEIGGWTVLATLLGRFVLAGGVTALFVYAAVLSLEALFNWALSSPALRQSRFIDQNQAFVRRWVTLLLRIAAFVYWLRLVLAALGLRSVAAEAVRDFLSASVSVGALSLSVGGVLAFVAAIALSMILSRLVHEVLEDEIFPRTNLPRGIPHALSTLIRYGIYSLGFLFALAAAGVQLGQLTILIGGLGVGIGLGLQDVVKNFAAGITLLLERRVHVGDAVQIPDKEVFGRVLSIGMRASVVRNWNGTEVIMPNDDLVSGAVTNWTLSDRIQRLQVEVGVEYGSDPKTVIDLLLDVARADARLLRNPPPTALFVSFGDSSLSFVLRAWTDEDYEFVAARRSDLAVAVHDALHAAGIGIPFPQRVVRLVKD